MVSIDPERSAFEALYADTFDKVFRYCLRRVTRRDDVDDVVAQVYATAWRRRDDIAKVDVPLAWLYVVARHTLSNQDRSVFRRSRLVGRIRQQVKPAAVADPATVALAKDAIAQVNDIVEQLRPQDRELIRLSAWEQLSYKEIAEILDISPEQVKTRLYRVRQRIKAQTQDRPKRDTVVEPDTNSTKAEPPGTERGTNHER